MKKVLFAASFVTAVLFGLAATPAIAVPTHGSHGNTPKIYQQHRNANHYYGGHIYRGPGWYFHEGFHDHHGWHEHGWFHHDHFDHDFHHGYEHHEHEHGGFHHGHH